jgi:hypothetical protein
MINKIFLGIGFALLVLIPIWIFLIVPEMEKLPDNFSNKVEFIRKSNTNHQIGGNWTGEILVKGTTIENTLNIDKNIQIIEGNYKAQDLDDSVLWEVNKKYGINKKTFQTIPEYGQYSDNSYYLFPQKLDKKSYKVWIAQYLYPLELKFKNIEDVQKLEAYHFEAKNFVFDDSEGFEWMDLVPEVYNVLADGTVNVWVEPITGIILNYEGGGVAYYADKQTGEKIQDIQTWSNKYSEDTIANQVRIAQNEKQRIILIEWIAPILMLLVSLAFFSVYYVSRKHIINDDKNDNTKEYLSKSKRPLVTLNN